MPNRERDRAALPVHTSDPDEDDESEDWEPDDEIHSPDPEDVFEMNTDPEDL